MDESYYAGFFIGALLRTVIILAVFAGVIRLIRRPISRKASGIIGVCFFVVLSVLPIIIAGSTGGVMTSPVLLINGLFGAVGGFGAYKIARVLNGKADDPS